MCRVLVTAYFFTTSLVTKQKYLSHLPPDRNMLLSQAEVNAFKWSFTILYCITITYNALKKQRSKVKQTSVKDRNCPWNKSPKYSFTIIISKSMPHQALWNCETSLPKKNFSREKKQVKQRIFKKSATTLSIKSNKAFDLRYLIPWL